MNTVLTTKFRGGRASVELFEDGDDLGFGEATFLHVSLLRPEAWNSQFRLEPFAHLKSKRSRDARALDCLGGGWAGAGLDNPGQLHLPTTR